jgi:leader peptidase (prepilin peptidase)/N-methyltransferase
MEISANCGPFNLARRQQAVVAAMSGILAALCVARYGLSGRALVDAVFVSAIVLLSAIDIDRRVLPNVIIGPTFAFVLFAQIALTPDRTLEWLLAALGAALFFFVPLLVYPAGIGMGDVKMAALLGAALGRTVIFALLAGLVAAAAFAVLVLAREGLTARRKPLPFGPFLAFGAILAIFLGAR